MAEASEPSLSEPVVREHRVVDALAVRAEPPIRGARLRTYEYFARPDLLTEVCSNGCSPVSITTEGVEIPLGLREGSTENATVAPALLAGSGDGSLSALARGGGGRRP